MTNSVVVGGVVVVPGSNAPGGLLGPYRYLLGTPRTVPAVHTAVPVPHSTPLPYENSALGSMSSIRSGQEVPGGSFPGSSYCMFGSSDPVARGCPGTSRVSVG